MIIKSSTILFVLLSLFNNESSCAFTTTSTPSRSFVIVPPSIKAIHYKANPSTSTSTTSTSIGSILGQVEEESQQQQQQQPTTHHKQQKQFKRLRTFGQILMERSDTLRTAGFYDTNDEQQHSITSIDNGKQNAEFKEPLIAGAKTNITLFLVALGYKWYRSIFINKMAIWERQPQWNTVITSKEDEEKANLEALTCKSCGATIFIAKGRKWFQMPRGYECYCCGASGNDNFENTRTDLLEEIDDDYFDYEKPLDFVTAAERKKLMKEAGGDEEKAIALLTQQNEAEAAAADGDGDNATGDGNGEGEAPKKKKKKKKKKKGKKKKKKKVESDDDADTNADSDVKAEGSTSSSSDESTSSSSEEKDDTDAK